MAIKKEDVYNKIENIILDKVFMLESENSQLKTELAYTKAKLEVYERIASVSDSKMSLGFGPPTNREGGI